jgi:hypothetical protein
MLLCFLCSNKFQYYYGMHLQDDFSETADFEVNGKQFKSQNRHKIRKDDQRQPEKGWGIRSSKFGQTLKVDEDQVDVRNGKNILGTSSIGNSYHISNKMEKVRSLDMNGGGKVSLH